MNFSYWERQFITDTADLTIIGSGITGMSAAYHASLRFPKWKIIVLDKFPLSNAASTRNAGFACFGSAGELIDDLSSGMQEDEVYRLAEKRFRGLLKLREIIGDKALDFQPSGGIELFSDNEIKEFDLVSSKLENLNSALSGLLNEEHTYTVTSVPDQLKGYKHAISNSLEGKINPGKMMNAWMKICKDQGILFYKGATAAMDQEKKGIYFGNHFIKTNQVAVCSNGLTKELNLNLELEPARNLILLSKPIPSLNLPSTYHHDKGYIYFRTIHDRLLIGGGRNKFKDEEKSSEFHVNQNLKLHLLNYLNNHFNIKDLLIDQEWTGIMGVSDTKKTLVKRLDNHTVCGVRLGGMGIAIGTLIGKEVSDLL